MAVSAKYTDKYSSTKEAGIDLSSGTSKITFSFEYFAPKTDKGMKTLKNTILEMSALNPVFVDCTWSNSGKTSHKTKAICDYVNNVVNIPACMHLTCSNLSLSDVNKAIEFCLERNISKILALRGDEDSLTKDNKSTLNRTQTHFKSVLDLVKHIKLKSKNTIDIGVAGYPEMHPDSKGLVADMKYLKEKLESGATFVITQLFYNVDYYGDFVKQCENYGINRVKIIPGILPINNYVQFKKIIELCKIKVPVALMERIEAAKENKEEIENIGVDYCVEMCTVLNQKHNVSHFHFYTLNNKTQTLRVLRRLNCINNNVKTIENIVEA